MASTELGDARFKVRFLRCDELGRLAELIEALQAHQQLKGVLRIPSEQELQHDLAHVRADGTRVANDHNTFVAVLEDLAAKEATGGEQGGMKHLVGYAVYLQDYDIIHGRKLYLTSLFIEKQYRFFGLGRVLMQFLRLHGDLLDMETCDVPYMLDNKIGIKFYSKYKPRQVGDEHNWAHIWLNSNDHQQ